MAYILQIFYVICYSMRDHVGLLGTLALAYKIWGERENFAVQGSLSNNVNQKSSKKMFVKVRKFCIFSQAF